MRRGQRVAPLRLFAVLALVLIAGVSPRARGAFAEESAEPLFARDVVALYDG